jgi:hypothetical protein
MSTARRGDGLKVRCRPPVRLERTRCILWMNYWVVVYGIAVLHAGLGSINQGLVGYDEGGCGGSEGAAAGTDGDPVATHNISGHIHMVRW